MPGVKQELADGDRRVERELSMPRERRRRSDAAVSGAQLVAKLGERDHSCHERSQRVTAEALPRALSGTASTLRASVFCTAL
jgi:hypothetical protein